MAKPKRDVLIETVLATRVLRVYCDRHEEQAAEVKSIEGVSGVTVWDHYLWVYVDPRYDLDEVAEEVKEVVSPV